MTLKDNPDKGRVVLQKLFEVRDQLHYTHLQTNSYAAHKALNEAYDELLELADTFVETYQGIYGRIKGRLSISVETDLDAATYIASIRHMFAKDGLVRKSFNPDETHLANIADEMLALIDHTQYLLTLS